MNTVKSDVFFRRAAFLWVAVATAAVLLIPLVAMQFTAQVNWGAADFLVMGFLVFGVGSVFVLISRRVPRKRRSAIAAVLTALLLYLWAELAVGIFTDLGS